MNRFVFGFLLLTVPWTSARSDISPVNLLEQALEAYLEERFDQSVALFQQVLQYDKKNETAMKGLESARKKQRLKVEKIRAKERPALQAADKHIRRGNYVPAIDRLRSILQRVPDHPKARSLMAKIRKQAQKQFSRSKVDTGDWFYHKGVLAYLEGDWFQAAEAWDKVYTFNPDRVSLLGEINQARRNLEAQQREERIGLYQNVAWDNLRRGNYAEAMNAWKEVLNIDPDNPEAQEGLKEAQEAESKEAARRREQETQSLSQRAMDAYIERDYEKSTELWKALLAAEPDNSLARDYLKRIQSRSHAGGDYRSSDYSSVYAGPTGGASAYQKGVNLLRDEKFPEGIESLERHITRNPTDAKAKEALESARAKQKSLAEKGYKDGLVAYSQGSSSDAIKLWQGVLRIDPDYQKARQALIKALAEGKKKS